MPSPSYDEVCDVLNPGEPLVGPEALAYRWGKRLVTADKRVAELEIQLVKAESSGCLVLRRVEELLDRRDNKRSDLEQPGSESEVSPSYVYVMNQRDAFRTTVIELRKELAEAKRPPDTLVISAGQGDGKYQVSFYRRQDAQDERKKQIDKLKESIQQLERDYAKLRDVIVTAECQIEHDPEVVRAKLTRILKNFPYRPFADQGLQYAPGIESEVVEAAKWKKQYNECYKILVLIADESTKRGARIRELEGKQEQPGTKPEATTAEPATDVEPREKEEPGEEEQTCLGCEWRYASSGKCLCVSSEHFDETRRATDVACSKFWNPAGA